MWFGEYLSRLRDTYASELPPPRQFPDPLGGLIRTILSQQNTRRVAQRQWEVLTATYPQWEAALLDGPDGIESTLKSAGGGLSRMKADYIYGILAHLKEHHGGLSLRFLREFPHTPEGHEQARQALAALPGVGHKTVALVLLFSWPLDSTPYWGLSGNRLDLNVYRWGGEYVRVGRELYGEDLHGLYPIDPPRGPMPFTYTPFAAVLFVPLTVLSVASMEYLWTTASLVSVFLVAYLTWRWLGHGATRRAGQAHDELGEPLRGRAFGR